MTFQEHHYRNLQRARDHLTETIISLQSAVDRMTGDDWIDATAVLADIMLDIAPRLGRLRTAASDRFDDHTRRDDFEQMRTGLAAFPDERPVNAPAPAPGVPRVVVDVPSLNAPNAQAGALLVAQHGSVDAAMRAYPPDSEPFDHVQAYRYVTTGKRPQGWVPPVVGQRPEGE